MRRIRQYRVWFVVSLPPAVRRLLVISTAAYLFQVVTGHRWDRVFGLVPAMVVSGGALWQLFTYALQHANPLHFLWNMLVLWMFGAEIEAAWGERRFTAYYAICAVGAALATVVADHASQTVTVGASGAIFGILAAFGVLFPDRPVAFMLLFPMRARHFVLILAGLQLLLFAEGSGGVAYVAHLGGLLTGLLYLAVTSRALPALSRKRPARRGRRPRLLVVPQPEEPRHLDEVPHDVIDRILDKISSVGIQGLTEQERALLERASKVFGRRERDDA